MNTDQSGVNRERIVRVLNGWIILIPLAALLISDLAFLVLGKPSGVLLFFSCVAGAAGVLLLRGFFSLQPNEGRVLVLFGTYKGSVRNSGFHWANPFYSNGRQGQNNLESRLSGTKSPSSGTTFFSVGIKSLCVLAH